MCSDIPLALMAQTVNTFEGQHLAVVRRSSGVHNARGGLHCAKVKIQVRSNTMNMLEAMKYNTLVRHLLGDWNRSIEKATEALEIAMAMIPNGCDIQLILTVFTLCPGDR